MDRKQMFQERRKQRLRKSLYRCIFSILLVLVGGFVYDNMNLDIVLKGIFANDEIDAHHVNREPINLSGHFPFTMKDEFAYSDSIDSEVLANELSKNNMLIGDNYKNIIIENPTQIQGSNIENNNQSTENGAVDQDGDGSKDSPENEQQIAGPDVNSKTVYLTFDDGPNQFSEQLLALLEMYNAKVTFFMIDRNIRNFPDSVNHMVSSGHSVGLHSVSHNVKTFYQSPATVISEMTQVRNTVKEITGIDTLLIRTPYGSAPHMQDAYVQAVHDNGFLMWDWNIDSKDWYYRDHRYVENCITQLEGRKDSTEPIVILLHEREETLAQLPSLLEYLKSQNYSFRAIDSTMTPVAFK